eukprot:TRINITY_DN60857_c0_g1_i1.p1 TRINITY_DN60857_c0_g1~~TRINITY_DN60857_c0_g1_i1.p1  ORF type:complete len:610 (-),score=95.44 TRINITY_DN60857_c0_g1_i1:475-2304(-)
MGAQCCGGGEARPGKSETFEQRLDQARSCSLSTGTEAGQATLASCAPARDVQRPPLSHRAAVHIVLCKAGFGVQTTPTSPSPCSEDSQKIHADDLDILNLARRCGAQDMVSLFDSSASIPKVTKRIKQFGRRCQQDDALVLLCSALHDSVGNHPGDDGNGVLQDGDFTGRELGHGLPQLTSVWLQGSDFARCLTTSVPRGTDILIISVGCGMLLPSGLEGPLWAGHRAIALSSFDGDMWDGVFTRCLVSAIDRLDQANTSQVNNSSVGTVIREMLEGGDTNRESPRDLGVRAAPGITSDDIRWPLFPSRSKRYHSTFGSNQGVDEERTVASWNFWRPHTAVGPATVNSSVRAKEAQVHLIVCCLDYQLTPYPLTCSVDGWNMSALARHCGSDLDIVTLSNEEATVANVTAAIGDVGKRCKPGDHLIFFYAGHGANLPDDDGDEDDGLDEAYLLVDEGGRLSSNAILRDDDFAQVLTSSVPRGTSMIIISDCCHSGTMADFNRSVWKGHCAVSVSGCSDWQTSADTGRGGIFTHCLLMAVEQLAAQSPLGFTVGDLCRAAVQADGDAFQSPQDLTVLSAPGVTCDDVAWPLVPSRSYKAPWRRFARQGPH